MTRQRLHTLESCTAAAAGCTSQKQFRLKNRNAYDAARRAGWLDLVCPKQSAAQEPWTQERVAEIAKLYPSRQAMRTGPHQWAYVVAKKNEWEDALPPLKEKQKDQRKPWSKEEVIASVKGYATYTAWAKAKPGAYRKARRLKTWIEEVETLLPRTRTKQGHWTKDKVLLEAATFDYPSEWAHESKGSYLAALRNGWLCECTSRMNKRRKADDDCFYMWKAKGCYFNGNQVYKLGITSKRLGQLRIDGCAKAAGLDAETVIYVETNLAKEIERKALKLGSDPEYTGFGGSTEFRALSQEDINAILGIINTTGTFVL